MKTRKSWLLLGLLLLVLSIGLYAALPQRKEPPLRHLTDNPENYKAIDSSIRLLQSGDLVLRTGTDAISYMLRQMNQKNKTYSHCGIVMIENGYPFVYHSIGGEDNPAETLRRDSASFFFSPAHNQRLGIVRLGLSAPQVEKLHQLVWEYYKAGVRFDMDFDMASNDKLYCAEFVYKAVCRATADSAFFPLTTLFHKQYVGVDDLYENSRAKMIRDYIYRL